METETPIVWLEKNLLILSTIVDCRDKQAKEGKTFTEEQTNYFLGLVELKNKYDKAIALLKAAEIN